MLSLIKKKKKVKEIKYVHINVISVNKYYAYYLTPERKKVYWPFLSKQFWCCINHDARSL